MRKKVSGGKFHHWFVFNAPPKWGNNKTTRVLGSAPALKIGTNAINNVIPLKGIMSQKAQEHKEKAYTIYVVRNSLPDININDLWVEGNDACNNNATHAWHKLEYG